MKPFGYSLHPGTGSLRPQKFQLALPDGQQGFRKQFGIWLQRLQTRRQLSRLGEDQLRDIGLTPGQVDSELSRPFWN